MKANCCAAIDDHGVDGTVSLVMTTGCTARIKRRPICGLDGAAGASSGVAMWRAHDAPAAAPLETAQVDMGWQRRASGLARTAQIGGAAGLAQTGGGEEAANW